MEDNWTEVAKLDDIPDEGTLPIEFQGEPVCLYNLGGQIYATHDICTHGHANLSDGFVVEGCLIECPLHQGTFDIKSGEAVGVPCTENIRTYPVKVEAGAVFLKA